MTQMATAVKTHRLYKYANKHTTNYTDFHATSDTLLLLNLPTDLNYVSPYTILTTVSYTNYTSAMC